MKVQMRFTGGQQLLSNLGKLPESVSRKVQIDALRKGAAPIQKTAATLAPRGPGAGEHLADNIVVGSVNARSLDARGRSSETVVEVGPELKPDDMFYGFFQEFGTIFHKAQPFMRPAFDLEAAKSSLVIIRDELWTAIRKRLPRGSSGVGA